MNDKGLNRIAYILQSHIDWVNGLVFIISGDIAKDAKASDIGNKAITKMMEQ